MLARPSVPRVRRQPRPLVRSVLAHVALGGLVASCAGGPVDWTTDAVPLPSTAGAVTVLTIRGAPDHAVALAQGVPAPRSGLPAFGAGACLNSARWSRADAQAVAVAWWVARHDSSVVLRLARSSDDGAHWDTTMTADERDRGVRGCDRPPPAVAFDSRSGYTHVAYFLEPPGASGVYYAHLMDLPTPAAGARASTAGSMFHAPVAIVYGESVAEASVAAHGDTVAVAYQNPNGLVPHVELALSVTAGHSFPRRVSVSGSGVAVSGPMVALDGATVAVAWRERSTLAEAGTAAAAAARAVVRIGTIR